jgi:hypothetical protein
MNEEKMLPFDQRRQLAQQRVREVLVALDVDIAPILQPLPSQLQAQLIYIDLQDEKMLMNLGLMKLAQPGSKLVN